MKNLIHDRWYLNRFFAVMVAFFSLGIIAGCAGENYGTVKFDRELDNTFVGYQVLPDHRYYITGGYNAPAAILAIHNDYQLDNDANLWVPVPDVSSAHMQKWIDNLKPEVNLWDKNNFLAYYILDRDGKRIGAWYSGTNTPVKFLEDGRIKVFTPNMKIRTDGKGRGPRY